MAQEMYVGINGKARKVVDVYIGVDRTARRVTDIYSGINGVARQVFNFEYPVKGNIIIVDPTGVYKRGRVLSITGTRAKILDLSSSSTTFTSREYSFILAQNRYNTYSSYTNFKNALVQTFSSYYEIENWYYNTGAIGFTAKGSPKYNLIKNGFYSPSVGYESKATVSLGSSFTNKYIKVASIMDIIDYLEATTSMTASNTVLTPTNIFKVFNISNPSGTIWLQDTAADDNTKMMCANSNRGFRSETFSGETKPVYYTFTVDLSKIGFKKVSDS